MTCARGGSPEAIKTLLTHGADIGAKEPSQNQTALVWAISERQPQLARVLIEAGADVAARTKRGYTPLHFAAREGDIEGARLLLAAGANVNATAQDNGTSLLVATMRAQVGTPSPRLIWKLPSGNFSCRSPGDSLVDSPPSNN